jgi:hypothetical protein
VPMIDPWEKAEECQRAMNACPDRIKRSILHELRELWVSVGNKKSGGLEGWHVQATDLLRVHTNLVGSNGVH